MSVTSIYALNKELFGRDGVPEKKEIGYFSNSIPQNWKLWMKLDKERQTWRRLILMLRKLFRKLPEAH